MDDEQVSAEEEVEAVAQAKRAGKSDAETALIKKPYRIRHIGTHVGNIVERIGETDFALVKVISKYQVQKRVFWHQCCSKRACLRS